MEAQFSIAGQIIRLLALHLPLILAAATVSRWLYPRGGALVRWVTGLSHYFLAITLSVWLVPRISYWWLQAYALLYLLAAGLIWLLVLRGRTPARSDGHPGSIGLAPLFALFGVVFLNNIYFPGFNHDSLTYQLNFAAAWLQEGRLFIVPTPFGDPSQAYGAALASTFYVWLMAPLQSDLLAAGGGLGFLALTCFAAMGVAREMGAEPRRLLVPVALLTLAPLLFYESTRALSDIAGAGFFHFRHLFFPPQYSQVYSPTARPASIAAGSPPRPWPSCPMNVSRLRSTPPPPAPPAKANARNSFRWRSRPCAKWGTANPSDVLFCSNYLFLKI